jgi:hypothetical protein
MPSASPATGYEALQGVVARAVRAGEECRSAVDDPASLAKLWQIASTVGLVRRLSPRAGQDLSGLSADVQEVAEHLERSSTQPVRELEFAYLAAQRVLLEVSGLVSWRLELWPDADAPPADGRLSARPALLEAYAGDARNRAKEAIALAVLAIAALAVAIATAASAAASSSEPQRTSQWLPSLVAAGMAFVVGLALLYGARRHRLASFEATRVLRQLAAFDELVAPLPPALQAITRATILRQLFPRLHEDSEPWTESAWPDPAQALEAIELDRALASGERSS